MTPDQITQLRHLLQQAKEAGPGLTILLDKALALLPCPTCNGTGQVGEEQSYQGRSVGYEACPDCK